MSKTREFIRHVLPAVIKPARTLWNEMIGFIFVVLAVWATPSGIKAIREFEGDGQSLFKAIVIGIFVCVMLWFGVSSFRRARKISRS